MEGFDAEDADGIILLPGVKTLFSTLPPNSWTIVTSASEQVMIARLRRVGLELPPNVVTADSVSRGKPDPERYLIAANLLNLKPAECLVIEDSPTGIRARKEAGCKVLGVPYSHGATQLADADWVVSSLEQVAVRLGSDCIIAIDLSE